MQKQAQIRGNQQDNRKVRYGTGVGIRAGGGHRRGGNRLHLRGKLLPEGGGCDEGHRPAGTGR